MSLILDALRKMEQERKAKRQGLQEIRAEVLNYRGTTAAPEKSRIVPIMAISLLICAAAACFFYYNGSAAPKNDAVKAVEPRNEELPSAILPQTVQKSPQVPPFEKSIPAEAISVPKIPKPSANAATVTKLNSDEGITVSGIAWADERYLRRAVINGSLVGEGAEIQGAKVIEIREDRVRFSRGGEIFEVVHSSGSVR